MNKQSNEKQLSKDEKTMVCGGQAMSQKGRDIGNVTFGQPGDNGTNDSPARDHESIFPQPGGNLV